MNHPFDFTEAPPRRRYRRRGNGLGKLAAFGCLTVVLIVGGVVGVGALLVGSVHLPTTPPATFPTAKQTAQERDSRLHERAEKYPDLVENMERNAPRSYESEETCFLLVFRVLSACLAARLSVTLFVGTVQNADP